MGHKNTLWGVKKERLFQGFKYLVYSLILVNFFYFLREDYLASTHTYRDGFNWTQLAEAFSQSTDTLAWWVLLMLFELQTWTLNDEKLDRIKGMISAVGAVAYAFIIIAFLGYVERMMMTYGFSASSFTDACSAVGQVLSVAMDLDDYVDLTAANCASFEGTRWFVNETVGMMVNDEVLTRMHRLSATDVLNAGAWLLIVVVLEVDVWLTLKRELTDLFYRINTAVKMVLYGTLIVCCLYWAGMGDLVGFWDAFVWILAFFLIELNLFKWQEEEEADMEREAIEDAIAKTGDSF